LALIAKNGDFVSPEIFSTFGLQYMSEDYTNVERWRNTGKEEIILMELSGSIVFAEYSISLSILWLSMKIHLKTH
jgi:hypothetical protein